MRFINVPKRNPVQEGETIFLKSAFDFGCKRRRYSIGKHERIHSAAERTKKEQRIAAEGYPHS
jgi:hypothetical protein